MSTVHVKERHGVAGLKKIGVMSPVCAATVQDGDGVLLIAFAGGDWVEFTADQAMLFAQQIQQAAERVGSQKL